MAVSIKLGADVVWGTSSAGTLTHGKLLSVDRKPTAKKFEQPDEDDELYAIIFYDQREEVTVEVLCNAAAALPDIGSLLTVAGVIDLFVMDASMKWSVGQTKKLSLTLMKPTA